MNDRQINAVQDRLNRRVFLRDAGASVGLTALGNLLASNAAACLLYTSDAADEL